MIKLYSDILYLSKQNSITSLSINIGTKIYLFKMFVIIISQLYYVTLHYIYIEIVKNMLNIKTKRGFLEIKRYSDSRGNAVRKEFNFSCMNVAMNPYKHFQCIKPRMKNSFPSGRHIPASTKQKSHFINFKTPFKWRFQVLVK